MLATQNPGVAGIGGMFPFQAPNNGQQQAMLMQQQQNNQLQQQLQGLILSNQ